MVGHVIMKCAELITREYNRITQLEAQGKDTSLRVSTQNMDIFRLNISKYVATVFNSVQF